MCICICVSLQDGTCELADGVNISYIPDVQQIPSVVETVTKSSAVSAEEVGLPIPVINTCTVVHSSREDLYAEFSDDVCSDFDFDMESQTSDAIVMPYPTEKLLPSVVDCSQPIPTIAGHSRRNHTITEHADEYLIQALPVKPAC